MPMLALIIPLSGGIPGLEPTPPIYNPPGYPAHPIAPPGYPTHPIAPGGPPPSVMPPIYYPPVIAGGPGWLPPMVGGGPIIPPGAPPGVGVMPPIYYPPSGGPPVAMPPIYLPGHPSHPIVIPPPVEGLPPGVPTPPIYIPPPAPGTPAHPIVIPPPATPGGLPEFPIGGEGWNLQYVPGYGWIEVPPAIWGFLLINPRTSVCSETCSRARTLL